MAEEEFIADLQKNHAALEGYIWEALLTNEEGLEVKMQIGYHKESETVIVRTEPVKLLEKKLPKMESWKDAGVDQFVMNMGGQAMVLEKLDEVVKEIGAWVTIFTEEGEVKTGWNSVPTFRCTTEGVNQGIGFRSAGNPSIFSDLKKGRKGTGDRLIFQSDERGEVTILESSGLVERQEFVSHKDIPTTLIATRILLNPSEEEVRLLLPKEENLQNAKRVNLLQVPIWRSSLRTALHNMIVIVAKKEGREGDMSLHFAKQGRKLDRLVGRLQPPPQEPRFEKLFAKNMEVAAQKAAAEGKVLKEMLRDKGSRKRFEKDFGGALLKRDLLRVRPEWSSLIFGKPLEAETEKEEAILKNVERALAEAILWNQMVRGIDAYLEE